jgi:hypothetical protein
MKTSARLLILAILCLASVACDHYKKQPDGSTSYWSLMTDNDMVVVDGELPAVGGFSPITNKKGVITGYRPVYAANPASKGEKVGFAKFGSNQSEGGIKALAEVRNGFLGWVVGEVTKASDANKAANEARQIDAAAATEKSRLANEAARDAQRHAENMAEFEIPAAPVPAP